MTIIYEPKGRALEYALKAINHYVGCDHGCVYCFVPSLPQWRGKDFYATATVARKGVIEQLLKEAPKYQHTDERVLLSFACDPYPQIEKKLRLTRGVLDILRRFEIPFTVLTKAGVAATEDFDMYGPNDRFATTLTFVNEKSSREYEPFAATPKERMWSLQMAKKKGISNWISLEPVIDPEQTLEIIRATHEFVDLYKIGKLNHSAAANKIDWRKFGIAAVELCREYKTDFYVKKDLAAYMDGFNFTSVDNRKVKRN